MSAFVPRTKSPSRRKSSKSPDTSPKYKVGDEFFTKYYSFNIRIKDIDSKSREYVFEKAYDKDIKTVDERRILDNKDLKLKFNDVDDFPKVFVSMQGRSSSDKGGRKTNRKKSGKKNKTGKKLKRSGKKLIWGGAKYKVGDVIKHKEIGVLTTITDIYKPDIEEICSYGFEYSDGEAYSIRCNLIDNETVYEKIEPEPYDVIIDIEEP